jgi:hypothetical protein
MELALIDCRQLEGEVDLTTLIIETILAIRNESAENEAEG